MSLRDRLNRLEGRRRPGRCDNCRGWEAARVAGTDWRSGQPLASGPPAKCPNCGFEPTVVTVSGIEDWRGQRRVRPE